MSYSTRILKSDDGALLLAKERRAEYKAAGVCINGTTHGARTHGCRCHRCHLVHRYGLARAEMILDVAARMTVKPATGAA